MATERDLANAIEGVTREIRKTGQVIRERGMYTHNTCWRCGAKYDVRGCNHGAERNCPDPKCYVVNGIVRYDD